MFKSLAEKMENSKRHMCSQSKSRQGKEREEEEEGRVVTGALVVCIPINHTARLLHRVLEDPLTFACKHTAGASWSPAFSQQTKTPAWCSACSITSTSSITMHIHSHTKMREAVATRKYFAHQDVALHE